MNDVTLQLDSTPALPTVLADPHALQQVLVNLVQNAIHALAASERSPRQVTVSAQARPRASGAGARQRPGRARRRCAARIFEPFFTTKGYARARAWASRSPARLAREHGGELLLEAEAGEGACFTLRLPVRAAPAADAWAPPGRRVRSRARRAPCWWWTTRPPCASRWWPSSATWEAAWRAPCDVAEAQRMLTNGAYDAVLLDVRMPGGSGLDLHRALEQRNPRLARRVVFMTGDFVNDDVLSRVRETGNAFLEKPFTIDELTGALITAGRDPEPGARFLTTTS